MKIIYEDESLLVTIKPQDMPVQPDKTGDVSFFDICEQYYKPLFLLHRLDRPVGGVIVFAKNKNVAGKLGEIISGGKMTKKYLTVVQGTAKENDEVNNYLIKNERLNISKIVQKGTPKCKEAKLTYIRKGLTEKNNAEISLLLVTLITGRHHQIRLQLAGQNLPIIGDRKYNKKRSSFGNVKNLALWSYSVSFKHPLSNENMKFEEYPENIEIFNCFDIAEEL